MHDVGPNRATVRVSGRIRLVAVLALCLAGAWICGQMLRAEASAAGAAGSGLFARVCRVADGAGLGCAAALDGRWSHFEVPVPLPTFDGSIAVRRVTVPIAFAGLAYFVFLGVWFAATGARPGFARPWHRLPNHVTAFGLAASIFYLGVMAFSAAPWCVWCLAVHAVNGVLVVAVRSLVAAVPEPKGAGRSWRRGATDRRARGPLSTREAITAVVLAAAVVGAAWMFRHERLRTQREVRRLEPYRAMVTALRHDDEFLLREHDAQPRRVIPLRGGETVPDGWADLVVFTDFQCPACICNAAWLRAEAPRVFGGRLRVRIRHHPLSGECNPAVAGPGHAGACDAARAAEAARALGGEEAFDRMHELLFERRGRFDPGAYEALAAAAGFDPERFRDEMDGERVSAVIRDDLALAETLGVFGTPTMFLDGRRVTQLCDVPAFWKAKGSGVFARRKPLTSGDLPGEKTPDPFAPRKHMTSGTLPGQKTPDPFSAEEALP